MEHLRKFNESKGEKLVVRVKHIIEYLQREFDPEATVHLDHDGWMQNELDAVDEVDLIDKRGIFDEFEGNLFINN